jgi:intein/homing endonuclease
MSEYQEEAIAQQLYDMLQKDAEGMHASYAYTKAHEDEYRNKSVEELICDPYFLGLKDHIFPQHLDDIIELWEERKKRPINLALFEHSIGAGKCKSEETYIFTSYGIRKIKEIVKDLNFVSPPVGTNVGYFEKDEKIAYTELGLANYQGSSVANFVLDTGMRETLKIILDRGFETEGTSIHPELILDKDGKMKFRMLKDISVGDYVGIKMDMDLWGTSEKLNENRAWIIGYLVGDGGLSSNSFTCTVHEDDLEIGYKFRDLVTTEFNYNVNLKPKLNKPSNYSITAFGGGLRVLIKDLKINCKTQYKTIPQEILDSPRNVVISFLRGLYDADGSIDKKGNVSLSTVSKELSKQLQLVMLNLGIFTRWGIKKTCWGSKGMPYSEKKKGIAYRLKSSGEFALRFMDLIGFTLDRKQSRRVILDDRMRNPNINLVPNVKSYLRKIKDGCPLRGRGKTSIYKNFLYGDAFPSKWKLRKFLGQFSHTSSKAEWDYIDELLNNNVIWLRVKTIEKSSAHCYDFHIPVNHNYIADGFISHNTMIASILIWLQWYEVATIYNPQEYYNLAPGSTIAFMTLSRTELQSKRVIFSDVFKRFQSPFNKDYFPPNPRYQKEIQIAQNNTVVYAGTSSELCLDPEHEVFIEYSKTRKLKDLIGQINVGVLGYDIKDKKFINTKCDKIVDTGFKELFEVGFDNKLIIRCTNDHKFLVRVNDLLVYKPLKDLSYDDEVVGYGYSIVRMLKRRLLGIKPTCDVVNSGTSNFIVKGGSQTKGIVVHNSALG